MNFWQRCESFPPILVRLLARTKPHGPPMSAKELAGRYAQIAGLDNSTLRIELISQETTWDGLSLPSVAAFTTACHLDFCNTAQMRRLDNYLRAGATLAHLRNHDQWATYWMPLLVRWRRAYPADVSKLKLHPPVKALLTRLSPLLNINYKP